MLYWVVPALVLLACPIYMEDEAGEDTTLEFSFAEIELDSELAYEAPQETREPVAWSVNPVQCPAGTTLSEYSSDFDYSQWCTDGNGLWQGLYEYFSVRWDNHIVRARASFVDSEWHGAYRRVDITANALLDVGTYKKNAMVSWWRTYNPDGSMHSEIYYDERGVLDGAYRYFTTEGVPVFERYYAQGVLHGRETNFQGNGQLKDTIEWDWGVQHGQKRTWHLNGQLQSTVLVHNGLLEGLFTSWDNAGRRLQMGQMRGGRPAGIWTQWSHDSGSVSEVDRDAQALP